MNDQREPEWFETFFDDLVNRFWLASLPPELTHADVEFLREQLGLASGSRILDAPCGTGRLAVPLAALGCRVTGIDISVAAVTELRRQARKAGLSVEVLHGDMRSLPVRGPFDAACCMGSSFGYFPPDELQFFLDRPSAMLRPGGRFALETYMAAESLLPAYEELVDDEADGIVMRGEHRYDATQSLVESDLTFEVGGVRTTKTMRQWVFTVGEIRRMLARAGLQPTGTYADTDLLPFELGAPRLLIVARRA